MAGDCSVRVFERVLTDVGAGIYVADWKVTNEEFGLGERWTIEKRRLSGGLSDGVDIVAVDNGAFSFTIVPTRGMGIWKGFFKGVRLGWDSPVENPVHPHHINLEARGGLGWLEGFNEWIVRCGLENFGAPGTDVIIDNMGREREVTLTLHGKIANIPAERVTVRVRLEPKVELEVEGVVYERSMFGPNLRLTTRIVTSPGDNKVRIMDTVENLKSSPAEMQLLYHCNYGKPVLDEGTRILAPFRIVAPRDARAAEDIASFDVYGPPETGFVEQVYFCELAGDSDGRTVVALVNRDETLATSISFSLRELPYFTIWKNTASLEEGYVTGLEPATSFPNTRRFEREKGRVIKLEPKGKYRAEIELSVHMGRDDVQKVKAEIERFKVEPKIYQRPIRDYST
ncbi:MAG: hypothetical protein AYL32_003990 [Candidatus Bathyarchaeota archaeon B26-2]|mgnify:CR=1 FL=1|nr:MAG: hypothetical protein AYL32_003990 [Candidatus Bathyarchaeota archaeon B26-2]